MKDIEKQFLEWLAVKTELDVIKKKEIALRKTVVSSFATETVPGTYHKMVEDFKFTASIGRNYKVAHDDLTPIWAKLTPEEKACIDYKPSVKVAAFKSLPPQSLLTRVVVETPATPTLAFKLVKGEK